VVVVVSEETGTISLVAGGRIRREYDGAEGGPARALETRRRLSRTRAPPTAPAGDEQGVAPHAEPSPEVSSRPRHRAVVRDRGRRPRRWLVPVELKNFRQGLTGDVNGWRCGWASPSTIQLAPGRVGLRGPPGVVEETRQPDRRLHPPPVGVNVRQPVHAHAEPGTDRCGGARPRRWVGRRATGGRGTPRGVRVTWAQSRIQEAEGLHAGLRRGAHATVTEREPGEGPAASREARG
jgi:hypothetical protein